MSINIEALRHLLAISFAVDLAYIALDRFRYYHICNDKLSRAIKEVERRLKEKNPAERDTSLTRIERRRKDISGAGLGPKLFIKYGARAFGGKNKAGYDVHLISLFAFLQYVALSLSCLYSYELWVSISIFIVSVLGTGIPVLLIFFGNNEVNEIEIFISKVLEDVSNTYTIPIAMMKENLDK